MKSAAGKTQASKPDLRYEVQQMKSTKGQGLSLNTIIIAILVLIVLIVVVLIFTGYFGRMFTPGVQSCIAKGGSCEDLNANPPGSCDPTKGDQQVGLAYTTVKDAKNAGCVVRSDADASENIICCRKSMFQMG
jgi:hypothetical protein